MLGFGPRHMTGPCLEFILCGEVSAGLGPREGRKNHSCRTVPFHWMPGGELARKQIMLRTGLDESTMDSPQWCRLFLAFNYSVLQC